MSQRPYRPGPGWRHIAGSVYEHQSGIRTHVVGICARGDVVVMGTNWPESRELYRMIRINGGNRRRGVMAWALRRLGYGGGK